jgi:ABC-2 type transport system ATP-binding protein
MVELTQVSKYFENKAAVLQLSLKVEKGDILGLLGPNGAGKTTAMRLIAGYYSPDGGEVYVDGVNMATNPTAAKKAIGYLPENNPLYTDMLVSEFLDFALHLKQPTTTNSAEQITEVATTTGILDVIDRPIKALSKGYKQRVGLAAALLTYPPVLILDEPTEGLDPMQRIEMRNLIKRLSEKHTVIMSTHVLQEVEAVCTKVVILDKGEKVHEGAVSGSGNLENIFKGLRK